MRFRKVEKKYKFLKNIKNKIKEYIEKNMIENIYYKYYIKKIFQFYRYKKFKKKKFRRKKPRRYYFINALLNTVKVKLFNFSLRKKTLRECFYGQCVLKIQKL